MTTDLEIAREAVETTARFLDVELQRRSPFHLAACGGCGGPSFQQPCPLCGYYPRGADKGHWHPKEATRDLFVGSVERSGPNGAGGNLATWVVRDLGRTTAYASPGGKARIEEMVSRAAALGPVDLDGMWKVVVEDVVAVGRHLSEQYVATGWRGIEELLNVASSGVEAAKVRPETVGLLREQVAAWVSGVHQGDLPACAVALGRIGEIATRISHVIPNNGNLIEARRRLEAAEEMIEQRLAEAASRTP